jgi:methionyl-tRNA formyltransferase
MAQFGEETFYPRRGAIDSELSIDSTIRQQFDLLRTVDNEAYPAFFYHKGNKYILKIEKDIL